MDKRTEESFMSKRVEYCKRLLKKAFIIEANLGPNDKEDVSKYIDELGEKFDDNGFLVDDQTPCTCKSRTDVVKINDRNYCTDCMCYLKEVKKK